MYFYILEDIPHSIFKIVIPEYLYTSRTNILIL
uniref:Uncharacterized protein n=1 Tax=Geladintestivirus 1 TaxID=3233133 RepID=A0AAU8MGC2_9CAUD